VRAVRQARKEGTEAHLAAGLSTAARGIAVERRRSPIVPGEEEGPLDEPGGGVTRVETADVDAVDGDAP
jgi:hypothetical protein